MYITAGSESPVLTEILTPSSIVHHTATISDDDPDQSSSTMETDNIGSDIALNNVGPSNTDGTTDTADKPSDGTTDTADKRSNDNQSDIVPSQAEDKNIHPQGGSPVLKIAPTPPPGGSVNLIKQMLGAPPSEFSASSLLSAAARAQKVQQQQIHGDISVMLGQQSAGAPTMQVT